MQPPMAFLSGLFGNKAAKTKAPNREQRKQEVKHVHSAWGAGGVCQQRECI
jgi:hypothetical protein